MLRIFGIIFYVVWFGVCAFLDHYWVIKGVEKAIRYPRVGLIFMAPIVIYLFIACIVGLFQMRYYL